MRLNHYLIETVVTGHAYNRLKERLKGMTQNNDITSQEASNIEKNIEFIMHANIDMNTSYGVLIGDFNINSKSSLLTKFHKSGDYYEINSRGADDVVKDSTGNEFWGIIRGGRLITVFLRKTVQRKTAHLARNNGGLGVDKVILDLKDMMK